MKKCASCTKDLPDAALHCVFCGAKQPPAPAVPAAANAKTVMGYGGQELEALRAQAAAANAARSPAPPANLPAAAPYSAPPPQPAYAPPQNAASAATVMVPPGNEAPRPHSPSSGYAGAQGSGGYPPPSAGGYAPPQGGFNPQPQSGFNPPPQGGFNPPPGGGVPPTYNPQPPGSYTPQPVQPVAPLQPAQPPYLASQTAARAGRPSEPWKDSLRIVMFVWGALLLVAFAAPLSLDPLTFNWTTILDGAGKAKLVPLLIAAVGVLSIVIGSLSLPSPARGAIAAMLGLAGIFVPMLINGMPPWQLLVSAGGVVLLVSSLLVRNEYRDASLARILVTVGVLATLVPYVVPAGGGDVPLVGMFHAVLDAEGQRKIVALVLLLFPVVAVLGLLAWLPAPSGGAAKPIAWVLILWGLAVSGSALFLDGGIDPTKAPFSALEWVVGGAAGGAAFLALAGYGIATLIGKQLE